MIHWMGQMRFDLPTGQTDMPNWSKCLQVRFPAGIPKNQQSQRVIIDAIKPGSQVATVLLVTKIAFYFDTSHSRFLSRRAALLHTKAPRFHAYHLSATEDCFLKLLLFFPTGSADNT